MAALMSTRQYQESARPRLVASSHALREPSSVDNTRRPPRSVQVACRASHSASGEGTSRFARVVVGAIAGVPVAGNTPSRATPAAPAPVKWRRSRAGLLVLPRRLHQHAICGSGSEFEGITNIPGSTIIGGSIGQGEQGFVLGQGPPGAWDSGGVGRPVVKRYLNGSEENWLMWYEGWRSPGEGSKVDLEKVTSEETNETGRQSENKEDQTGGLPPSCVGLALSANGLIWTRGSTVVETDAHGQGGAGMVLKPSSNWWSFDTRHVKASDVIMMASPKVRASGGVFWMFYEGHSNEEVEIPSSVSEPARKVLERSLASGEGNAVAAMLRSRPGLALSNDGRNWAAIEGEHHSGAVLDVGAEGEWDRLAIGSPHVVFHSPGDLRMYYHALDPETGRFFLGLARSRDGLKWLKLGQILKRESSELALGYWKPQVLPNPGFVGIPEESYVMVSEKLLQDGRGVICLAESPDGLSNWRVRGEILGPSGNAGAWDGVSVHSPCLVDLGEGTVRLYYEGRGPGGKQAIGVAEAVNGSLDFTRHENVLITFTA